MYIYVHLHNTYIYTYVYNVTFWSLVCVEPSLETGTVAYITMTVSDIDVVEGMV